MEDCDMNMLILTYRNNIVGNNVLTNVDSAVPVKPDIESFWNVESIGITDKCDQSDDEKVMERFKGTLRREDGRYQVTWPWRDENPDLPENRSLAIGRLRSLANKLGKHPEIMESDKAGKDHNEVRVVYDASAKTRADNKSLNKRLHKGPVLLRDLCGILLRFRLPTIGIVSDIEKAFLQVGLQPSQRDITRFLWFKDYQDPRVMESNLQEYRFCRVPFGAISSPFLLGATIESHLDTYPSPLSSKLKDNTYMDNIITGTDSVSEAVDMYTSANSMFNDAKMNLREWMTNNEEVKSRIPTNDKASESSPKVLGHTWNVKIDTISLQKAAIVNKDLSTTKRNVLRQVASVFDPLALLSPVTLQGKVLLQNLWKKRLEWDETLEAEDVDEWLKIKDDLNNIDSVDFPRCISLPCDKEHINYTSVCFCDASNKAYASSVYLLQVSEESATCDLIFSKCRLAPVKPMTIPRLELMAVLIGVRCTKYVVSQMKLSFENIVLLSDSQCVLQWISSKKSQPAFIENRLKEIRSHEDVTFAYVNTKENPANIASRGCSLHTVKEHTLWWHGPNWMLLPYDIWPNVSKRDVKSDEGPVAEIDLTSEKTQDGHTSNHLLVISESDKTNKSHIPTAETPPSPFEINEGNFSSVRKLFRVTAWCHRFVSKLKCHKPKSRYLTSEELALVENMWLLFIQRKHFQDVFESIASKGSHNLVRQLDLFIDDLGLLRCGGRLDNAILAEAARHPILLPKQDNITHLYIRSVHQRLLHSGVSQSLSEIRQKFWIPHGSAAVRKVLKDCKVCVKLEGGPYKLPNMAPLPTTRVSVSTPFSRVGLDYLGPFCVKINGGLQKIWLCLFTCLVTRAMHLELVQDMSAKTFLYSLRRFIATRGTPKEIISDNAKHFKLSSDTVKLVWQAVIHSEDVQSYVSCEGITWSFIVEIAPWMGGFYERLVGLVKRALRKTIGRKHLTLDQMTTLTKEAESVVNSRPLVYVGDDLKSSIDITPRHFTCLNPNTGIPESEIEADEDPSYDPYESSSQQLLRVWKKGEHLLNTFWQIWRTEYLLNLRERSQMKMKSPRVLSHSVPCVGDVVLIKDDIPRGQWKMGKLLKLTTSQDGQIRSAEIRTSTGNVLRNPIETAEPHTDEQTGYVPESIGERPNAVQSVDHIARPKRQAAEKARKRLQKM